jgi:septal ring factor EnvC (AmiA/AmiB activator)
MMAVDQAETRLGALENGVRDQLRALYRLHRRGPAQLVFGADDPAELRRRGHYLVQLVEADAGRLYEFQTLRDKRKAALDALDADMARLSKLRATLELKETELRDQRAARMDFLKKVRERRGMAMQAMGERELARDRFDRTLDARMVPAVPTDAWAGGMGLSGPAVPTAPSQASSFRHAYGRIPWPVRGRLVRRFGPSLDPATGLRDNNRGIDIAAEFGEPVRGVYRGVVRVAGPLPDLGQTVAIQHGSYTTIYAHLSGMRVEVGDVVNAGEVVGVVGNTGLTAAEGYRLSFEIRYNRSPQDPLAWLQR